MLSGALLAAAVGVVGVAQSTTSSAPEITAMFILPALVAIASWIGLTRRHEFILLAGVFLDLEILLTSLVFSTGGIFGVLLVFLAVGLARLQPDRRIVLATTVSTLACGAAAAVIIITVGPIANTIPLRFAVLAGLTVTAVTVAVLQWVFLTRQERALDVVRTAELEAARARGMLDAILAASPMSIVSTDTDGRITYFNAAAESLTGVEGAQALGSDLASVMHASPEESESLGAALLGTQSVQMEPVRHLAGGRPVDERSLFAPLRGPDGDVTGAVVITEDVTERVKLESQLRQAQKMETLGQLSGAIAHDFNNMLQAIRGYAELASASSQDQDVQASVDEIKRAADRAAELTRQLLTFSQPGRTGAREVDVAVCIGSAVPMIHRLVGPRINLITDLASDTGSILIDPTQLEQAVLNLAVNARDAMPAGGELSIVTCRTPDGEHAQVVVRDTGSGIPAQIRERMFEPFFTTKDHGEGTGLGLTIVLQVVRNAGGEIAVESAEGSGTAFLIRFPIAPAAVAAPEAAPARNRQGNEVVLLVEDEQPIRQLAERVLRARGYSVLSAANASDAKLLWRDHRHTIRLLLTDVSMPGGSGADLAHELVAEQPSLATLLVSGHLPGDPHAGLDGLTAHFLQKPFTVDELLEAVRDALDGTGGSGGLP